MAQNDLKHNHASSSSEDDEEEASGSEADSDEISDADSGEKPKQEPKKALTAPPQSTNTPQPPELSSSETEESGSDTDSDLPPKKSAVVHPNVKPAPAKAISTPPPAKSKRPPPAPAAIEKDAKKDKQNTANGDPKKAPVAVSQSAPDLYSSGSESDTDSDLPPKKPAVVHPNVKPALLKVISTPSQVNNKRPPTAPASIEKDAKKAKQNTANGEFKKASAAVSQSAPDLSSSGSDTDTDFNSDLPPKKSAVVRLNVKLAPAKVISTPPPAKSKRPPPAPMAIEKDAKKAKQSTANGEFKKASVAASQSAPDLSASGSYTDSDSLPKTSAVANPIVKPISSKPMQNLESKSAKNSRSKTTSTSPPAKSKPAAAPAPTTNEKDVEKAKNTSMDDDSKRQLFQRVWSEDDEIALLEGMISYKNKRIENPTADIRAFHEFVKKSLNVKVNKSQLSEKIRRLKQKYVNKASREKDGNDKIFSKSHEQKGYELSKLIWGSVTESKKKKKNQSQKTGNSKSNAGSTSTSAADSLLKLNGVDDEDRVMMEVEKSVDVSRFVQYVGRNDSLILPQEIVKAGMELVDGSRRTELEGKWRKLKEQELVLYVQRMELLKEQALAVLEAIRSSGN